MQNKILVIIFAVAIMQLIYFLVKGIKDRLNGGNLFAQRKLHARAIIVIILFLLLIIFMLI